MLVDGHMYLGWIIGRYLAFAGENEEIEKFSVLVSLLPDMDHFVYILLRLISSNIHIDSVHRTWSHSVCGMFLMVPLSMGMGAMWFSSLEYMETARISFILLMVHGMLDFLGTYGLRWLYPFGDPITWGAFDVGDVFSIVLCQGLFVVNVVERLNPYASLLFSSIVLLLWASGRRFLMALVHTTVKKKDGHWWAPSCVHPLKYTARSVDRDGGLCVVQRVHISVRRRVCVVNQGGQSREDIPWNVPSWREWLGGLGFTKNIVPVPDVLQKAGQGVGDSAEVWMDVVPGHALEFIGLIVLGGLFQWLGYENAALVCGWALVVEIVGVISAFLGTSANGGKSVWGKSVFKVE